MRNRGVDRYNGLHIEAKDFHLAAQYMSCQSCDTNTYQSCTASHELHHGRNPHMHVAYSLIWGNLSTRIDLLHGVEWHVQLKRLATNV